MNDNNNITSDTMKELKWIESKSKVYDTTEGELNGKKAIMTHKEFKGNLPFRMIKSLKEKCVDNVINLDTNGSWVTLRFSSKKGNNYSEIYINRVKITG